MASESNFSPFTRHTNAFLCYMYCSFLDNKGINALSLTCKKILGWMKDTKYAEIFAKLTCKNLNCPQISNSWLKTKTALKLAKKEGWQVTDLLQDLPKITIGGLTKGEINNPQVPQGFFTLCSSEKTYFIGMSILHKMKTRADSQAIQHYSCSDSYDKTNLLGEWSPTYFCRSLCTLFNETIAASLHKESGLDDVSICFWNLKSYTSILMQITLPDYPKESTPYALLSDPGATTLFLICKLKEKNICYAKKLKDDSI